MLLNGIVAVFRSTAACAAFTAAALAGVPAHAQPAEREAIAFDIPSGSLQSALTHFASQSGLQLIYSPETVAGKRIGGFKAKLSARSALRRLLASSGLGVREINAKVVIIEPRRTRALSAAGATPARPATPKAASDGAGDASTEHVRGSEEIIVTGSHIRGVPPVGSHVRTIDREEIERNGYSTVSELLQGLPGNFGGTAT